MVDDSKKVYEGKRDYSFDDEFVVFDIETTGLRPSTCEIIEIGAVRVCKNKVLESFHSFVDPGQRLPYTIISLTGITDDMLQGAPGKREVLEKFHAFVGDSCLVAHNSDFDTSFVLSLIHI